MRTRRPVDAGPGRGLAGAKENEETQMRCFIVMVALLASAVPLTAAWAQKQGGVLRITHRDSPASMSIHEEGTISVVLPMMGVFNNLVVFDQHKRQNSL